MSKNRLLWLLGLLVLVLGVRWVDPLAKRQPEVHVVSEPVERAAGVPARPQNVPVVASRVGWPVRERTQERQSGNAFLTRGEVAMQMNRPAPLAPTPPPVYEPPAPPPAPVERGPLVQVLGTWGKDSNLAVFLGGPQGTVLAHVGDVLWSQYRVQAISAQQLTLQQISNERVWPVAIPVAPASLQTWPPGQ